MDFNTATLAKFRQELGHRPKVKAETTLMTPGEVAKLFRVDPKTVTRWAAAGKLRHTRTPGGHVRFYRDEIMEMVEGTSDVA